MDYAVAVQAATDIFFYLIMEMVSNNIKKRRWMTCQEEMEQGQWGKAQ